MSDDLVNASFDGDTEAVTRLLDAGLNSSADDRLSNALHAAIENENLTCVQLLIRRGADVEHRAAAWNLSPLAHAVDIAIDATIQSGGCPGDEPTEIIHLLLDAGADPASGIQIAKDYKSVKIVELLTSAENRQRTSRGLTDH